MKQILYFILVACVIVGCKRPNNPKPKVQYPAEYVVAYQEDYGRFYDSISRNVYAIDLYSEGLDLDENGKMVGSGWNLYLSDIFAAEDTLPVGEYHSATTGEDHTFLPGMDFDGMPHGAYLLQIDNAKVSQIVVLEQGCMTIRRTTDQLTDIALAFIQNGDTTYRTHFQGIPTIKKNKKR